MNFNGNLIYCGGIPIPTSYIAEKGYKFIDSIQDSDSVRTQDGYLHRTTIDHHIRKVEITTRILKNTEYVTLMNILERSYTVPAQRKLTITAYNTFKDEYEQIEVYVQATLESNLRSINDDVICYDPQEIHFIEY